MTDLLQQPLHGIAIYNPDLLSKQELIGLFSVRQPLLERLLDDLRHPGGGGGPHHLLIGPRGMGKTTLLRRLRYAVEDDPELQRKWLPLTFPEEQYNVVRLSDLYLNWIDALGDALEQGGRSQESRDLDNAVIGLPDRDEDLRAREALKLLMEQAQKTGKRLLLLIDNLDLILSRLKKDQWAIRDLLSQESGPILVGASSLITEDFYQYGSAFYDYFQIDELRGLTEAETQKLLLHLSRLARAPDVERMLERDPARIKTLRVLTGGNPRTVVLLYNVLALGVDGDVRSDLQRLLDHCTPLYKARFEGLATQAQQIMDALAIHWDPISAGELAGLVRLETNIVSSQLNRLVNDGLVEKVAYYPGTKTGFQIAERFFNIWYLMRASRRLRTRLVWLVEFLRSFFAQEELTQRTRKHLEVDSRANSEERLKHAEFSLALAQVIDDSPLRGALESTAIRSLVRDTELRKSIPTLLDFEGDDASLSTQAQRFQYIEEAREKTLTAKITWAGWSAERFWGALSASPSFALKAKVAIARSLESLTPDQVTDLRVEIETEVQRYHTIISHKNTADQLFEAISQGYMVARKRVAANRKNALYGNSEEETRPERGVESATEDVEGAKIAAEALHAPALPAIALSLRLGQLEEITEQQLNELKNELSGTLSPYPWHRWALAAEKWGRVSEAEAAHRKAAELDSAGSLNSWTRLAVLLYKQRNDIVGAETAIRKAIELDPFDSPKRLLLAILLLRRGNCAEGLAFAERVLMNDSTSLHDESGPFLWAFFAEAARSGHSARVVESLDQLGFGERWRPIREALATIAAGTRAYLRRVAPEIREPAEDLVDRYFPDGFDE